MIRYSCGWLAAFVLVFLVGYYVEARWLYSIAIFTLMVVGSMFPGVVPLKLAFGTYEQFVERFPRLLGKERARAQKRSKTSLQAVLEWSAFTKLVIILGFGLPSGLFFLFYFAQGDWGLLVAAIVLAVIPAALIAVLIRGRLSLRPRPE